MEDRSSIEVEEIEKLSSDSVFVGIVGKMCINDSIGLEEHLRALDMKIIYLTRSKRYLYITKFEE
jgi:hypothetical protein